MPWIKARKMQGGIAFISASMQKYERDLIAGKIPAPFKVKHHVYADDVMTNKPLKQTTALFKEY